MKEAPRQLTAAPVHNVLQPDIDEQMNEVNLEFSDAELELEIEEPITRKTRSQSRVKENSMPPAEPILKTKVKKGAKKIDPDYVGKTRRRRVIEEDLDASDYNTD